MTKRNALSPGDESVRLFSGLWVRVVRIGPCYRAAGLGHAWLFFQSGWKTLVTQKKNASYNMTLAGIIVVPYFPARIRNIEGTDLEF